MTGNQINLEKLIETYGRLSKNAEKSKDLKTMITIYQNTESKEISISLYNCLFSNGNIESQEEEIFSTTDDVDFNEIILPALLGMFTDNNDIKSQDIRDTPFYDGLNYAAVGTRANLQLENFDRKTLDKVTQQIENLGNYKADDKFALALQYARLSLRTNENNTELEEERQIYEQANKIISSTNGAYNKLRTSGKLEYLNKELQLNPENKALYQIIADLKSGEKRNEIISNAFKLANFKLKHKDFLANEKNSILIEVAKEAVRDGYFSMPLGRTPKVITGEQQVKVLDLDSINKFNYWDRKRKEYLRNAGPEAVNNRNQNRVAALVEDDTIRNNYLDKAEIARGFEERVAKINMIKDDEYYESMRDLFPPEGDATITPSETEDKYVSDSYKNEMGAYRMTIDPENKMSDQEFERVLKEESETYAKEHNIVGAPEEILDRLVFAMRGAKKIEPATLGIQEETRPQDEKVDTKVTAGASTIDETPEAAITKIATMKANGATKDSKKEETIDTLAQEIITCFEKLGLEIEELKPVFDDNIASLRELLAERKRQTNTDSITSGLEKIAQEKGQEVSITDGIGKVAKEKAARDAAHYENIRDIASAKASEKEHNAINPVSTTKPQLIDKKAEYERIIAEVLNSPRMKTINEKLGSIVVDKVNINSLHRIANPNTSMVTKELVNAITEELNNVVVEYARVAISQVKGEQTAVGLPRIESPLPETVLRMRQIESLVTTQEDYKKAYTKMILARALTRNNIIANDEYSKEIVEDCDNKFMSTYNDLLKANMKYIREDKDLALDMSDSPEKVYKKSLDIQSRDNLAKLLNEHFSSDISKKTIGIIMRPVDDNTTVKRELNIEVKDGDSSFVHSFKFEDQKGFDSEVLPKVATLFASNYDIGTNAIRIEKQASSGVYDYTVKSTNGDFLKLDDVDRETTENTHKIIGSVLANKKNTAEKNNTDTNKTTTPTSPKPTSSVPTPSKPQGLNRVGETAREQQEQRRIKRVEPPVEQGKIIKALKNPLVRYGLAALAFFPALIPMALHDIGKYKETHPGRGKRIVRVDESKTDIMSRIKRVSRRMVRGLAELTKDAAIIFPITAPFVFAGPVGQAILGVGVLGYGAYFAIKKFRQHTATLKAEEVEKKEQIDRERAFEAQRRRAAQQQMHNTSQPQQRTNINNEDLPIADNIISFWSDLKDKNPNVKLGVLNPNLSPAAGRTIYTSEPLDNLNMPKGFTIVGGMNGPRYITSKGYQKGLYMDVYHADINSINPAHLLADTELERKAEALNAKRREIANKSLQPTNNANQPTPLTAPTIPVTSSMPTAKIGDLVDIKPDALVYRNKSDFIAKENSIKIPEDVEKSIVGEIYHNGIEESRLVGSGDEVNEKRARVISEGGKITSYAIRYALDGRTPELGFVDPQGVTIAKPITSSNGKESVK